jgi:hypothetical protein
VQNFTSDDAIEGALFKERKKEKGRSVWFGGKKEWQHLPRHSSL